MKPIFIVCLLLNFGVFSAQSQISKPSMTTAHYKQPPFLTKGDTVAIVAPSGILKHKEAEIQWAQDLLQSWGLHVVVGDHIFKQNHHFAGTDKERASDFQKALDDSTISAIWCARGGYGAVRILDRLDFTKFKKQPKWLVGYSDITALHNAIHNEGVQSIHAIMCTSLTEDLRDITLSVETLKQSLFGNELSYVLEGSEFNRPGKASGILVGGNLTMLHTMLGSNTSLDTEGKILFIEEIGEYKYHIDRMLQSLKRAGYFEGLKGLVIGDFSKIKKNTAQWGTSIEQLILDAVAEYDFPVGFNMPAGHEEDNRALILGSALTLEVTLEATKIEFKH